MSGLFQFTIFVSDRAKSSKMQPWFRLVLSLTNCSLGQHWTNEGCDTECFACVVVIVGWTKQSERRLAACLANTAISVEMHGTFSCSSYVGLSILAVTFFSTCTESYNSVSSVRGQTVDEQRQFEHLSAYPLVKTGRHTHDSLLNNHQNVQKPGAVASAFMAARGMYLLLIFWVHHDR